MARHALVDKKGYFFAGETPAMSPQWPTSPVYSKATAVVFDTPEAANAKVKYGISPNHRQSFRVVQVDDDLNIL